MLLVSFFSHQKFRLLLHQLNCMSKLADSNPVKHFLAQTLTVGLFTDR